MWHCFINRRNRLLVLFRAKVNPCMIRRKCYRFALYLWQNSWYSVSFLGACSGHVYRIINRKNHKHKCLIIFCLPTQYARSPLEITYVWTKHEPATNLQKISRTCFTCLLELSSILSVFLFHFQPPAPASHGWNILQCIYT